MAKRFEDFKLDGSIARKLDNGFLVAPVYPTRAGIFKYRRADGSIRRELRHPDEVFHADSLASMQNVPFTNKHPSEMVTSKNVRQHMQGVVGSNVSRSDNLVSAEVTVMDEGMVDRVEKKGITQVSCGYTCDMVMEPGEYEGEKYDAKQTNIRYNHLAGVERGRAGPDARIVLDSEDAEMVEDSTEPTPRSTNTNNGGSVMSKVKIDGVEYEVSETAASAIVTALNKRDEALDTANENLETVKTDSKKEVETLQGKFDQLTEDHAKLKTDAEGVDVAAAVKARMALVTAATTHLDKETVEKIDDMSDVDVKVAVIKSKSENFDAEGKSDDYIQARFDSILEMPAPTGKGSAKLDNAVGGATSGENSGTDAEKARKKYDEDSRNAWQKPLSASVGGN